MSFVEGLSSFRRFKMYYNMYMEKPTLEVSLGERARIVSYWVLVSESSYLRFSVYSQCISCVRNITEYLC